MNSINDKPNISIPVHTIPEQKPLIGKGGFGTVRLDTNITDVATKEIPINITNPMLTYIEPCISRYLNHPNIIKINDILSYNGNIQMKQELGSMNADTYIRTKEFNITILRKWIYQLLSALDYLHDRCIIHGDVKIENLIIMPNTTLKLCDFGLACKKQWKKNPKAYTSTHRAPEVWNSTVWDEKADVWALGCTVYELCSGTQLISPVGIQPDQQEKMCRERYKLIKDRVQALQVPDEIKQFILSCTDILPSYRPSIKQLLSTNVPLKDDYSSFNMTQDEYNHIQNRCLLIKEGNYTGEILRIAAKSYSNLRDLNKGDPTPFIDVALYVASSIVLRREPTELLFNSSVKDKANTFLSLINYDIDI